MKKMHPKNAFSRFISPRYRRGGAILDVMIPLIAGVLFVIGILFLAQNVVQQKRLTHTNELITRAVFATHRIIDFDGEAGTTDFGPILKASGEFPVDSFDSNDKIITGLGSTKIAIEGTGVGGDEFQVTIDNLTQFECLNVAQKLLMSRDAMSSLKLGKATDLKEYTHARGSSHSLRDLDSNGLMSDNGCIKDALNNQIIAKFK